MSLTDKLERRHGAQPGLAMPRNQAERLGLRGTDYVELHEVGGAADAHGGAGYDADDVVFADQFFFEEALFGDGGEAIDFANVGNVARHYAPDQRHAAARFGYGRKRHNGHERAVARDEARGESAVGEDGNHLHVQFAAGVANEFGNALGYF